MRTPSQALDTQLDIYNWSNKPHCYKFLGITCDYEPGEELSNPRELADKCEKAIGDKTELTLLESKYMLHMSLMIAVRVMDTSDTYILSDDAHQLIQAAKKSLPIDLKLEHIQIPKNNGMIFLDSPHEISEFGFDSIPDKESVVLVEAISWYDMQGDMYIVLWGNPHQSTSLLSPFFIAPINNDFTLSNGITFKPEDLKQLTDWLITFWTFISQKVKSISQEKPGLQRATSKRAIRAGYTGDILAITLRRREHAITYEPGETEVQWSHRWLVGGHWKNQYYPSTKSHQLIFIDPYIKGPENLPLIVKDKVYNVLR